MFNDPNVAFKSETFIVLMVIAWTYLLHAYYRRKGIEYRYYKKAAKRRTFFKVQGAYRYWELETCLDSPHCPIDRDTGNNLRFLIGLRHQIEHQMTRSLDGYLSGRYQACALNYCEYLSKLFGTRYALDKQLTYSIQFAELLAEQLSHLPPTDPAIPPRLKEFISGFDRSLSQDEYDSQRYSYRLVFTRKLGNHPESADRVFEFIDPKSELAKAIDKQYWVKKEVERKKYTAKHVVAEVQKAGFPGFKLNPQHLALWREVDAKNPTKGFGVQVEGAWYWYETWIQRCIQTCEAHGDRFRHQASK